MTRVDWILVRRIAANIAVTAAVLAGIAALLELLNTSRFAALAQAGGPGLVALWVVTASVRFLIEGLPLVVLIGAILGLLSLQASREMTVIKASGQSIWRVMRGPLLATVAAGLLVSFVIDVAVVTINRTLAPSTRPSATTTTEGLWIEERGVEAPYVLSADVVQPGGTRFDGIMVFFTTAPRDRLEARSAELGDGAWELTEVTRLSAGGAPQRIASLGLPTTQTPADMSARLSSVGDRTVFELLASLEAGLTDPERLAQSTTRLLRLIALPLTLAGSLVIAFAFTAGYRRTNKYGGAVLYGIVLGFVLYVVQEMATRAGYAGAIDPVVASIGPGMVALVAGATVLLNREDGRT